MSRRVTSSWPLERTAIFSAQVLSPKNWSSVTGRGREVAGSFARGVALAREKIVVVKRPKVLETQRILSRAKNDKNTMLNRFTVRTYSNLYF